MPKGLTSKKVQDPTYATIKQQRKSYNFFSLLTVEIQFIKKQYSKKILITI